ncbi:MAG: hypothetical protein EBU96_11145, partial [Actinobacteria bacterium]|nr:hypothetical protein [Actinomycetota bacterium]
LQRQIEATLGSVNIKLDPSVYLASQPIYTPLISSQTYRTYGSQLDVQATLSAWPAPVAAHSSSGQQLQGQLPSVGFSPVFAALILPPENPTEIAKVNLALSQVSADCSYNEWRDVLFSLHWTHKHLHTKLSCFAFDHQFSFGTHDATLYSPAIT